MTRSKAISLLLGIWICFGQRLSAAQWYAATTGVSGNTGSLASPWDLQTALNKTNTIANGDTLYLRAGTYSHAPQAETSVDPGYIFQCDIFSTATNAPIIVRPYPGEIVRIDGGAYVAPFGATARPTLRIGRNGNNTFGCNIWIYDIEFFSSSTEGRTSTGDSSFPTDITRSDGPYFYGDGIKLINCVVHDLSTGLSSWDSCSSTEFYGNVCFNNGWQGTPHQHGHNYYTQTAAASNPGKTFRHNVSSNPYEKGIQMYGSSAANVNNYRLIENTWMGATGRGGVLIGTKAGGAADRLTDNVLSGNFGYRVDLSIYYQPDTNAYRDVIVIGNYFRDGQFQLGLWKNALIVSNTFLWMTNSAHPVDLWTVPFGNYITGWTNDFNTYYISSSSAQAFVVEGVAFFNLSQYRAASGYDLNSTLLTVLPATNYVIIQTNAYNADRANLIIYNWTMTTNLNITLADTKWQTGDTVVMHNAQDYNGDVTSATLGASTNVMINMLAAAHTVAIPYGDSAALSSASFPMFGTFVLKRTSSAPPPPPVTNSTINVASVNPNNGVSITHSPNDIAGLGTGTTSFARTNTTNVVTTLVAPSTSAGNVFGKWQRNGVDYSANATITVTNVSNITLTAIYTTPTHVLTVDTSAAGGPVNVLVSPADVSGLSNGDTTFSRTNVADIVISLTAPSPAPNGNLWSKWKRDGVDYSISQAITVTNEADHTMTLVFSPPAQTASSAGKLRAARRFF